jgi:uncharacterized protein DUF3658
MIYQRLAKVFLICSSDFGLGITAMDRTRAAEIQRHLLEAADAIERAREIIFSLDEDDRAVLSAPIEKIASALHFELLHQVVYAHYPDLRWEVDERSDINTVRRWEEIILPEAVSDTDIDSIIFSNLSGRWQKTAMVVGNVLTECKRVQLPVSAEMLSARIRILAEANRLDSQGDLRRWRLSEVRLIP